MGSSACSVASRTNSHKILGMSPDKDLCHRSFPSLFPLGWLSPSEGKSKIRMHSNLGSITENDDFILVEAKARQQPKANGLADGLSSLLAAWVEGINPAAGSVTLWGGAGESYQRPTEQFPASDRCFWSTCQNPNPRGLNILLLGLCSKSSTVQLNWHSWGSPRIGRSAIDSRF